MIYETIKKSHFQILQSLFSQIERILKINNLSLITTDVVEAARDSLVLGIKWKISNLGNLGWKSILITQYNDWKMCDLSFKMTE